MNWVVSLTKLIRRLLQLKLERLNARVANLNACLKNIFQTGILLLRGYRCQ